MRIAFITVGAYEREDYAKDNLFGTEHQIFGLSKELVKKGHEVYIFRRWFKSGVETIENVNIISFNSIDCKSGLKLTFYKLKFSREVAKYIKKMRFDVLILMDPFTAYFTFNLQIPKITVMHNEIPIELLPNTSKYNIKKILLKIMQKQLFKSSDILVALNNSIKDYLDNKGYNTYLIPNGIKIEDYVPKYSDAKYILFGGRLVKPKRIDILIKAYSRLNNELKNNYELKIVGFGPEKPYLEKLVRDYNLKDKVKFLGWLKSEEFLKIISKCSIFVLPSLYETFGIVTIESMALNKPVIASNTYGSKDILDHGYNGFLFENGNIEQLTKWLDLLLRHEDLRKEIGKNARKKVEENYTFDTVADKYIKLFNHLLN